MTAANFDKSIVQLCGNSAERVAEFFKVKIIPQLLKAFRNLDIDYEPITSDPERVARDAITKLLATDDSTRIWRIRSVVMHLLLHADIR